MFIGSMPGRSVRSVRRRFLMVVANATAALMVVQLAGVAAASDGSARWERAVRYRPDASIRALGTAGWRGDDVYNTTATGQTYTARLRLGRMIEFEVRAQNDGAQGDTFKLLGTRGTAEVRTTYWYKSDNVTGALLSGSFKLAVPAGRARTLVARMAVAPDAAIGAISDARVLITSLSDRDKRDAVKARVKVLSENVIDTYIKGLPAWEEVSPTVDVDPHPTGGSEESTVEEGGTRYECTTTPYSLTKTPDKLVTFAPDSNVLWLGSLLQGKGYMGGLGSLLELPIRQRAPLAISLDLLTKNTSRTVQDPTVASVQQAIGQLIDLARSRDLPVSSNVSFRQQEMYSFEQAMLELGLSGKYLGAEVKAGLDVEQTASEHTVMAYFYEKAFTASMVLPQTPGALFSEAFSQEKLNEQIALGRIGEDNLPVFVDSLTFGRVLMFSLTSTESTSSIQATLDAVYDGPSFGGSASLEAWQKRLLRQSEIRVATIGGDSQNALDLIRTGDLGRYFKEPPSISSYRPISYTIRNLGDLSYAKVASTDEYDIVECHEAPPDGYDVTITFDKAHVEDVYDECRIGECGQDTWDLIAFRLYVQGLDHLSAGDGGTAATLSRSTCSPTGIWQGGICPSVKANVKEKTDWIPPETWSVNLAFDDTHVTGDWGFATLKLRAEFCDNDTLSKDEWSKGDSKLIYLRDVVGDGGSAPYEFSTYGDATWRVYVTIEATPTWAPLAT